jgi:DNA polymerase-3 subunit delta
MMAERQVVIVKEASRTIDKLESYADNPMPLPFLGFVTSTKH